MKGSRKCLTDFGHKPSRYFMDQLRRRGRVWGEVVSAKRSPLEAEPLRVLRVQHCGEKLHVHVSPKVAILRKFSLIIHDTINN